MATTVEIEWDKYEKYIIRDVHEKWHNRVQNFMLEKYFKQNRLFKQLNFDEDPLDTKEYLKYVKHILNDECSIIVLREDTDEIFAIALVKCMTKDWRSWAALQIYIDACKFSDVVDLQYRMINEYAREYPDDPFDSLHLFEYYVSDELRNNSEFMMKFFHAIYETARHMKMPRITFLALSQLEQHECFEEGYTVLSFAIYSVYKQRNKVPFAKLRDIDEMEAVLYQMDVETLIPYNEMIVRGIDDVVVQPIEKRSSEVVAKRQRSINSVDE